MKTTTTGPQARPKKQPFGTDWNRIFRDRPDLEPPGYRETADAMAAKSER